MQHREEPYGPWSQLAELQTLLLGKTEARH